MIGKNTVVTVCNAKGGVGKSTLAVHLAWTRLMDRGGEVALIDAEPDDGLVSIWADARALNDVAQIPVIMADDNSLEGTFIKERKNFHNIVIDTPGKISSSIEVALKLSDVAVIPITDSPWSGWKIPTMVKIIAKVNKEKAEKNYPPLRTYYVLNGYRRNAVRKIAVAKDIMKNEYGIECANAVMSSDSSYDEAIVRGLTIFEYSKGKNFEDAQHRARQEIHSLAKEVFLDGI